MSEGSPRCMGARPEARARVNVLRHPTSGTTFQSGPLRLLGGHVRRDGRNVRFGVHVEDRGTRGGHDSPPRGRPDAAASLIDVLARRGFTVLGATVRDRAVVPWPSDHAGRPAPRMGRPPGSYGGAVSGSRAPLAGVATADGFTGEIGHSTTGPERANGNDSDSSVADSYPNRDRHRSWGRGGPVHRLPDRQR